MTSPLHSRLPPSSALRWLTCTASVKFIEDNASILPKESSVFADEGSLAHSVASHLLGKGDPPSDPISIEMMDYARDYAHFVLSKQEKDDRLLVERRIPLFYLPEQKGTVDAAVVRDKSIYISDFKYGVGVGVYAKGNKQLAIYAESLIRELEEIQDISDDTLVTLAIYQPRDRNDSDPVRLWALTRVQLREFCSEIQVKADLILSQGKTEFVPDPEVQCRFCPAKGICKHYASYGLQAIPNAVPEKITLPSPESLTREQRVKVVLAKKTLISWLEAVEDQEVAELMAGAPRQGLKLVAGKTNRTWTNEEEADKLLANHLSAEQRHKPWEVISVAQAEKALKGIDLSTKFSNRMAELVTRPEGKPSIVPETDKREALMFNPSEGLQNVDVI